MSWIITVNGWGSVGQDATAPLVKIIPYADDHLPKLVCIPEHSLQTSRNYYYFLLIYLLPKSV